MSVTRHIAHTRKLFNFQDMTPFFALIASTASWYFNYPFLIAQLLLCQGRLSCLAGVPGNVHVQRLSTILC
jgi:hypothetical protein